MPGIPPKKTISLDNLETFLGCLKDIDDLNNYYAKSDSYTKSEVNNIASTKIDASEIGTPNGIATLDSEGKIPASQLSEDVADITVTANEYSDSTTYHVGDYVSYEGNLYVCTEEYSGAWDENYFSNTNVAEQLEERQTKTLENPITIDGTEYTTVESAVNAINNNTVKSSEVGSSNGIASLDSTGKVPSTQLPSYVDDVLEYASTSAFPVTGESGKIYVALDTNKTYRWGGSEYAEISESLAIGETATTAFAGNRGKAIEDKIPSNATSSNQLATKDDIDSKQPKTLSSPITVEGTSYTTVESAMNAINGKSSGGGFQTKDYVGRIYSSPFLWLKDMYTFYEQHMCTVSFSLNPSNAGFADWYDNVQFKCLKQNGEIITISMNWTRSDYYTSHTFQYFYQISANSQSDMGHYLEQKYTITHSSSSTPDSLEVSVETNEDISYSDINDYTIRLKYI